MSVAEPKPPTVPTAVPAHDPNDMRDAVLAVLRGESTTEIAAWYNIPLLELKRWVDAFLNAGSDALAKLDRS